MPDAVSDTDEPEYQACVLQLDDIPPHLLVCTTAKHLQGATASTSAVLHGVPLAWCPAFMTDAGRTAAFVSLAHPYVLQSCEPQRQLDKSSLCSFDMLNH